MTVAWLFLTLFLILLILGFVAVKFLFFVAAIVFAIWVVGWLVSAGDPNRHWYYW